MPRQKGVHTAVVLPVWMVEKLRRAPGGISSEIRRRLALTFEEDGKRPWLVPDDLRADRFLRNLFEMLRAHPQLTATQMIELYNLSTNQRL